MNSTLLYSINLTLIDYKDKFYFNRIPSLTTNYRSILRHTFYDIMFTVIDLNYFYSEFK